MCNLNILFIFLLFFDDIKTRIIKHEFINKTLVLNNDKFNFIFLLIVFFLNHLLIEANQSINEKLQLKMCIVMSTDFHSIKINYCYPLCYKYLI